MTREKEDTGSLTGDNRRQNEGRRARAWAYFVIPGLVAMTGLGAYGMMQGLSGDAEESAEREFSVQQPLPRMPSDSFEPKTQAAEPATAVPPQLAEALAQLEEEKKQLEQQTSNTGRSQTTQTEQQKPKRIRVISGVADIARPPTEGPGSVVTSARTDVAANGDGSNTSLPQRQGGIFSKNRLEDPYKCMASAGTVIPLSLPEGFNTEQEGTLAAPVTSNSYSRDKSCLTIPKGSIFHGHYKTEVSRGQQRVSLTFSAIERPPPLGDTIMLDNAKAYERDGRAGLTGEINSNIPWGMIIASTVIDIGTQWLRGSGSDTDINIGGAVADNAGSVLRDVARDRYQKAPPSIDVGPKAILVRLDKHLEMVPFPE